VGGRSKIQIRKKLKGSTDKIFRENIFKIPLNLFRLFIEMTVIGFSIEIKDANLFVLI
jgi:hypothetical protein